jgi:hypothetical protein
LGYALSGYFIYFKNKFNNEKSFLDVDIFK